MDYRNAFFKLSDYRNIEYWTGKFGKLSDYRKSDTKLKLSGYRIRRNLNITGDFLEADLQLRRTSSLTGLAWPPL
jgi:hypothetical protein